MHSERTSIPPLSGADRCVMMEAARGPRLIDPSWNVQTREKQKNTFLCMVAQLLHTTFSWKFPKISCFSTFEYRWFFVKNLNIFDRNGSFCTFVEKTLLSTFWTWSIPVFSGIRACERPWAPAALNWSVFACFELFDIFHFPFSGTSKICGPIHFFALVTKKTAPQANMAPRALFSKFKKVRKVRESNAGLLYTENKKKSVVIMIEKATSSASKAKCES